jgi:hypothetical protein
MVRTVADLSHIATKLSSRTGLLSNIFLHIGGRVA